MKASRRNAAGTASRLGIGLNYRMYHIVGKEAVFPSITSSALEQLTRVRYALLIEKSSSVG